MTVHTTFSEYVGQADITQSAVAVLRALFLWLAFPPYCG